MNSLTREFLSREELGWLSHAEAESDLMLVAVSPHLLRCFDALRQIGRPANAPLLLLLQVTPRSEWIAAGVLIKRSDFGPERRKVLSRTVPAQRSLLLKQWFEPFGQLVFCRPDTLEYSGEGSLELFSENVFYLYSSKLPSHEAPLYPVLRAYKGDLKTSLLADPGLAWRRTVCTDDAEIAKLLATCEHPDLRVDSVYADCKDHPDGQTSIANEGHTFFLNAFRHHSFLVEIRGPSKRDILWDFAEDCFGRLFGRESCFLVGDSHSDAICARVASPSLPVPLEWRISQSGRGFVFSDHVQTFSETPRYLLSRREFVAWAFQLF